MRRDGRLRLLTDRARLWHDDLRGDLAARVLRLEGGNAGYPLYDAIRARGPLVRSRRGLLFTASHAVASQVLRSDDFGAVPTMVSRQPREGADEPVHPLDDSFISFDPPRHTALRALVAPWFTRNRLPELTAHITQTVDDCLQRLDPARPVDLIESFAEPIPVATICHLLGLPPTDSPRFIGWGHALAAVLDGPRTRRDLLRTQHVITDMTAYFRQLIRQPQRSNGLVAELVRHCPHDLAARDIIATCEMLLLGGFATTVNLIGNAIHALLNHPDQRTACIGDYANAIEEALRYEPPLQYTVRITKTATHLDSHPVARRTPIVILLAGANRDPAVFENPTRFDTTRTNTRMHVAFGAGIHFCLGATLARAEATIALNHLFQRYPDLSAAAPSTRRSTRVLRGFAHLPVRLAP
jgi:cytochrome P450